MSNYRAQDWYWNVGGAASQVWSSKRLTYVNLTDTTYLAWVANGNTATTIANAAELGGVMVAQVVPLLLGAGIAVTSTGTPALNGTYALDQVSQDQITGIATSIASGKGLPGGGSTFNWPDVTGTPHTFSATNFQNFAAALESYIYDFTQALAEIVQGVPSITLPVVPVVIA